MRRCWWVFGLIIGCSNAPPVAAPTPPAPLPPPVGCDESGTSVTVDPASTLGFTPNACTLHLAGSYAVEVAYPDPPPAIIDLLCLEGDEALSIIYRGAVVTDVAVTELFDPYNTGGRESPNLVNYSLGAPTNTHYRFESGALRFHRPPRALLDTGLGDYVEVGLDLSFEGNRRFRAELRICPTYAQTGPVSDPVY